MKVLNELIDGAFGIVPEIYDFIAPDYNDGGCLR